MPKAFLSGRHRYSPIARNSTSGSSILDAGANSDTPLDFLFSTGRRSQVSRPVPPRVADFSPILLKEDRDYVEGKVLPSERVFSFESLDSSIADLPQLDLSDNRPSVISVTSEGELKSVSPRKNTAYGNSVDSTSDTDRRILLRCSQCSYTTDRKNNIPRHVKRFHKPMDCLRQCCGHTFTTEAPYRRHKETTHKKREFVCSYPDCGKAFPRKLLLHRHTCVHTGEKPHACSFCDYRSIYPYRIGRHERDIHLFRPWKKQTGKRTRKNASNEPVTQAVQLISITSPVQEHRTENHETYKDQISDVSKAQVESQFHELPTVLHEVSKVKFQDVHGNQFHSDSRRSSPCSPERNCTNLDSPRALEERNSFLQLPVLQQTTERVAESPNTRPVHKLIPSVRLVHPYHLRHPKPVPFLPPLFPGHSRVSLVSGTNPMHHFPLLQPVLRGQLLDPVQTFLPQHTLAGYHQGIMGYSTYFSHGNPLLHRRL